MKKNFITKLFSLCCLLGLGIFLSPNLTAQCPIGETNVAVTVTAGSFPGENGWELVDVTAGTVLLCQATGNIVPGTFEVCVVDDNDIEIHTFDDFGDSWNGATIGVSTAEDATVNGCAPQNIEVIAPFIPAGTGVISTNDCLAPSAGAAFSEGFSVACIPCLLTCSGDITVAQSTLDATSCGGFVNVPAPLAEGCATVVPADFVETCSDDTDFLFNNLEEVIDTDVSVAGVTALPVDYTGPVIMTVCVTGDFGDATEVLNILGEDGVVVLGTTTVDANGVDCTETCTEIELLAADYTTMAADGSIDLTIEGNPLVQVDFCPDNFVSVCVNVPTTTIAPLTNDFNNTADASGVYPLGTTTVTWTAFDDEGNPSSCSQDITIIDDVAPVLAGCPSDGAIGLQPGQCNVSYNFNITSTDNCPVAETPITFNAECGDPNAIVLTASALSCPAGPNTYFQFVDVSGPGTITGVTVGGPTTGGGAANVTVYDATGVTVPSTALTVLATGSGTIPGSAYGTLAANGAYGAGVTKVLVSVSTTGSFDLSTVGCGNATTSWIAAPGCGIGISSFDAIGFPELGVAFALEATQPVPLQATADPLAPAGYNEFEAGDYLPVGEHCFQYEFTDAAGLQSTCDWCVTVNEYNGPISNNLFCNANINVGVDASCEVEICADAVLEGGPYGCYDNYVVTVLGVPTNATAVAPNGCVKISADLLPGWAENGMFGPFDVMVTDPNGNTCWNTGWMAEDKMAPTIDCGEPIEIACTTSTEPAASVTGSTSAASGDANASWADGDTDNVANVTAAVSGAPNGAVVTGVTVSLQMDHSWVSDLDVSLVAPDGTSVLIMAGECGANDNVDATFDDAAATAVCVATANNAAAETCNGDFAGNATLTGTVAPAQALSGLNGAAVNGDWTLSIDDGFGGDGGCVANFSVNVNYEVTGATPPIASDNCATVTLEHTDNVTDGDCTAGDEFLKVIERTWTATDAKGHTATCVQIINVNYATLTDVTIPSNYDNLDLPALDCSGTGWVALADGNPSPVTTGEPTGLGCGNLGITYEDLEFPICEDSWKVRRRWTVYDWCTGTSREIDQIIKILDTTAPVMDCGDDMAVSTTTNSCEATFFIYPPATTDNCNSTITLVPTVSSGTVGAYNGTTWMVSGLAIGNHTITWTATDGCDNSSNCTIDVTVTDDIVPVAICETHHVVSLTTNEPTLVYASTFDDGSHDNCGIEIMEVRRMNPSCINFDWTTNGAGIDEMPNGQTNNADRGTQSWYPAVPFACCDVGSEHMVEFRVTDIHGNRNTCMVSVEVDDKLDPVVQCPPAAEYQCSNYINEASDIAIDGLNDLGNGAPAYYVSPSTTGPGNDTTFVGHYELAYDNCDVTVYIRDNGNINNCGIGNINRFYTAVDGGGRTDVCVQQLSVVNDTPYTGPINFPGDRTLNSCDALTDPSATGEPNVGNDNTCSQVAVTHTDLELPVVDGACKKILRTWIVIDWCSYNANANPVTGYWEDTQIIKVLDNEGPSIDSGCEEQFFDVVTDNDGNATNGCTGPVTLTITASDPSTCDAELQYEYWIDWYNDGNLTGSANAASGSTSSYTNNFAPMGTHSAHWSVEDACGNITTCEYLFHVEDNTAPYIVIASDYVTDLANGTSTVWATEFVGSYDDECSGDCFEFRIGVPSAGPGQVAPPTATSHEFTDADLGDNMVDWWIKDCANNWTYVTGIITVQDNTPGNSIAGTIATETGAGVNNVTVNLAGNAPGMDQTVFTNTAGGYAFNALPLDYNYTVTPDMDLNPLNGVSTYDLVLISQHILQTNLLDSPYKMIAADVNLNGSITTIDMVELRKLILFIENEFPVESSTWRFVESDFVFPNAANPWASTFPEETFINGLTEDQVADFVAVKKGDVNGTAVTGFDGDADGRTFNGDLIFNVENRDLVAGQSYTVDFTANDFNSVLGYQFTMAFDNNTVEVTDVQSGDLAGMSAGNFGMSKVNEGVITTSWNSNVATSLKNNEVAFSVTFTAKQNTSLDQVFNVSSRFTAAEAYNADLDLMNVAIEYTDDVNEIASEFRLLQNTPNPFKAQTVIGFSLPEASFASLKVFDISGRVIRTVEGNYTKGYNEVTINSSELSATGVMYYQLETAEFSATKKMIILE